MFQRPENVRPVQAWRNSRAGAHRGPLRLTHAGFNEPDVCDEYNDGARHLSRGFARARSMREFISASVLPLLSKSDLSSSSDKKSEVRMNGPLEPSVFIRKMKNCSGSIPLTLATPNLSFGIVIPRFTAPSFVSNSGTNTVHVN